MKDDPYSYIKGENLRMIILKTDLLLENKSIHKNNIHYKYNPHNTLLTEFKRRNTSKITSYHSTL